MSSAPSAAAATPAANALASRILSGVPLARADCFAQRGHFCPTTVFTMQRGQMGSPQLEQVSRVSTSGWFTHAGAMCAESVAIATSIYGGSSVTAWPPRPVRPATRASAGWNSRRLESVVPLGGKSVAWRTLCAVVSYPKLEEALRADGHVPYHCSGADRRFRSRGPDRRALHRAGQPAPDRDRRR